MPYDYNICTNADEKIFQKQCKALEKHIPNIKKGELLEDVDGSKTQFYCKDEKKIAVKNSFYIGAVFVESEISLEQFFK